MTWIFGALGFAAVLAGLRWLLHTGDRIDDDIRDVRRRSHSGDAPDIAYVPAAGDAGRPGH